MRRVRIGFQFCNRVIGLKGSQDILCLVHKIQHKGCFLAGINPVQTGKRLHSLHPIQTFIHIHGTEQGLIIAGLVFIGHQQDLIILTAKAVFELCFGNMPAVLVVDIHPGLGVFQFCFRIDHSAAEGYQRMNIRIMMLAQVPLKSQYIAHCLQAAVRHHHRFGSASNKRHDATSKVLNDDLRFLAHIAGMQAHEFAELFSCLLGRHAGIILSLFDHLKIGAVGGVALQHIKDKAFFDGLAHAVVVEGSASGAEKLDCLALGGGREGKEAEIGLLPTGLHHQVKFVLPILH